MERLLNAVLEGHWSIDEAIRWFSSTGFPLPQDALIQVPQALEGSPRIIRAKFAAQILDRVRDEVGCILAAEETRHPSKPAPNEAQRAVISQSQTSSPVATPATCGGGASAHHVAKSKQAPQQLFPSSSASDVAVRRPGALTDADFPSLGGDASRSSRSAHRKEPTSRGGSNNDAVRGSGSLPRPAGTKTMSTVHNNAGDTANIGTNTNTKPHLTPPPLQMPRVVATRQGTATNNYTITHTSPASCDSSAASTPMASRRRIQPTAVASVEVSKTFVGAAPQRSPVPAAPTTARIAAPECRAQDKQSAERLAVLELRRQSSNKTTTTFTANNNDNDDDCNDAGQQWPDVHAVGGGKPRAPPATAETPWSSGLIKVRAEYNNKSSESFDVGKNIVGDCGRVHSPEQRRVQAVGADVEPCGRDSAIPSAAEPPAVPTDDADVVGSTARLLEHTPLSDPGCRLAALHAMVVSHHSDVYLADQIDLLMNLLAVPLAVRRRVSQRKGESVGRLLTCGLHAQQYAALVLTQAGCLLRALGARLLEGIAATATDTLEELSSFSMPTYMPPPQDDRQLRQMCVDNDYSRITAMEDSHGAHASGQNNIQESRRPFQVLRDAAAEAERALASRQLRTEKAFNAIKSTDGFEAGLQGLGAFTSDGHRHRHPEEQRRLRNRETARNEWYELMRDASAHATSFGTNVSHPPSSLSTRSSGGGEDSHHDAVVLGKLQVRAGQLVRSLRPDNMGPFAELFTAAVLQAAATGEAFMDSELTSLAKKVSSSKFASLTKRFVQQGEGPGAPRARAGPTRFQRAHSKQQQQQQQQRCVGARASGHGEGAGTMGGVAAQPPRRGSSELSGADAHASSIGNQHRHASSSSSSSSSAALALHHQPQYHKAGRPAKGGPLACDEVTMAAASIAAEFPPVLRLYVLFLEAADSHRLNVNITRVMTHRLLALTASGTTSNGSKGVGGGGGGNAYKEGAAGPGMGEKAVIMATLASFLGYLTFTKFAGASVTPPPLATHALAIGGGDVIASSSAPIDVVAALQAAYNNATALVRTLPWVVRYLKFLPWDQEALVAPYYQRALGCVSKLRDCAELSPKSSAFGPAALCLRALLDDLVESVPILLPQQSNETHQHQHTTQSHNLDKGGACKHSVSNDVPYNNGDDDDASNALSRKETAATAHAPVLSSTRAAALAAADAWVDSRYMEVCCPLLVQATRLFVFAGGGGGGDFRGSGDGQRGPGTPRTAARIEARVVKIIRPTAPRGSFKSTSSSAASSSSSAAVVDFLSSKGEDAGGYDDSAPADGLTTANSKFSTDESSRRHGGSEERLRKVPLRAPCIAPAPRKDISVRLQATFLRQYSGEERRVKLQDVVEFCSDVIGSNAATSAMMATAPPAVESACAALADHVLSQTQNLVASRATDSVERDGNDGDESGNKAILALLEPTLRRYAVEKGESMATSTAQKVIDDAFKLAQHTIREHAVRAVVALAPPDLTQPVLETAAAMVAETATAGCAPLLVDLAQKQVHDAVMRGAERAVASALKALK